MVNKKEESVVDSSRSSFEVIQDEEINLYDYWKVVVKRKKILIGIFLIPLVIVAIVSLSLPRYYRGEIEINYRVSPVSLVSPLSPVSPILPANIGDLVGNIDDAKKVEIFTNYAEAIRGASVLLAKKSTDKLNIVVEAKTADIIPQAFNDIFNYISNIPEIKKEVARIKEETDLKINKLIEAKKVNLLFLNQITDMMKKRQITVISINPSDLINKDATLSLEIMTLQRANVEVGTLGPFSVISKQPSSSQIKKWIIITCLLSFLTGIFAVFFLEYIDRIKAREK